MGKQWVMVGSVAGGVLVAAAALIWVGATGEGVGVGNRAPDFRLVDLRSGDSVSLRQQYQGSVTLVNIWATWCVPCRVEMPAMQRLYDSLAPRGFRIAAVSIDEAPPGQVLAFTRDLNLTFDILQDQSGRIKDVYQTTGVPESFLLDENGIILKRVISAYDWASPVNVDLIQHMLDGEH